MNDLARVDTAAVVKAVAIAVVAGVVIGLSVGFIGFGLGIAGVLTEDAIENSLVLHGLIFSLGLLPNLIAGYFAARFAGENEILNGVAAGAAMLAISGLFYLIPDEDPFTFMDGIALLLAIPLAAAGAGIAKRSP